MKQQEQFKELYLKGYSATMIFREFNQYYDVNSPNASIRMQGYRRRLGLPKRGGGFKPTVSATNNPEILAEYQEQKRQLRIKKLRQMIPVWMKRVKLWANELQTLEQKANKC